MQPEVLPALGVSQANTDLWTDPLGQAMGDYEINTPARQAAFLAQILHESGLFKWVRELWGPTEAQKGYEGRHDLGNEEPGDGFKYRGRGLIQITGRANYAAVAVALGIGCENHPEMLEQPQYAAESAAWYWKQHGLNELADAGAFQAITRKINGGLNGEAEREALWEKAKAALSI